MKHLILITGTQTTEHALKHQLSEIFHQEIFIETYSVDYNTLPTFKNKTILFSSQSLRDEYTHLIKEGCAVLVAARNVNYEYIDRLFDIPPFENVLYVNDSFESAIEGIYNLQSLGIEHLHYHPFDHKTQPSPSFSIAITPGEEKFVPKRIERTINLGVRLLDLTTILNIAKNFQFPDEILVSLTNRYLKKIIELSKRIVSLKEKTLSLEKEQQKSLQRKGYVAKYTFANILGKSESIMEVKALAAKLADSPLPFFIQGESGTGKELFASAIHMASSRKQSPFLAINCSALPEDLLESELFGYEEGAFTGARKGGKKGVFEQAHGGTLFLDEIGDISLKLQARLLRVLQEYEIRRIGGDKNIPIDVRLITATNKDLEQKIIDGAFRDDLYYRLKILFIDLPPLRERKDDLPLLITHFVHAMSKEKGISKELMTHLQQFQWKGNIRELRNVISYLVTLAGEEELALHHLPPAYQVIESPFVDEQALTWLQMIEHLQHHYSHASRSKLMEVFPDKSEQQIRTILTKLQKAGYITMNKGRSGTTLTPKGLELLHKKAIGLS